MPKYEALIVMGIGVSNEAFAIDCLDDEAAIEAAQRLLSNHDVELWRGQVKLGTLRHDLSVSSDEAAAASNVTPFWSVGRSK